MRVIAIFNHKGGCGKTTTAINLAATLAGAKRRVLLIDLDPQSHATIGCGVREDEVELSSWHAMRGGDSGAAPLGLPDIAWEIFDGFNLAPASVGLASLEQSLAGAEGREMRLRRLIEQTSERYDFILIDCGPGLGILSVNALVAATEVLVPVDLGFFSTYGLARVAETIEMVAGRTGRQPVMRVLATMYDSRARSSRQTLAALREQHGPTMLDTVIRYHVGLREAAAMGSPIAEFRPDSRGHEDYRALAQELLAAGLQLEYEEMAREEARARRAEEHAVDRKIEMVYGAIPIDGGVRFVCHSPGARQVQVAGDFNQWSTAEGRTDLAETDQPGVWTKELRLPPGRYAYRLVIDGRWCSDPANPYVESNPYGELNSVVEIS
jgi:chromosome partitioning protein